MNNFNFSFNFGSLATTPPQATPLSRSLSDSTITELSPRLQEQFLSIPDPVDHSLFESTIDFEEICPSSSNPIENIATIIQAIKSDKIGSYQGLAELIDKLGSSLYTQRGLSSEKMQVLIIQLREAIGLIEMLHSTSSEKSDSSAEDGREEEALYEDQSVLTKKCIANLREYLEHMMKSAQTMEARTSTTVQDSCWPLRMKLLGLPGSQADVFDSSLGALREQLIRAPKNNATDELRQLSKELKPPALFVQTEGSPGELYSRMTRLSTALANSEETKHLSELLLRIKEAYLSFCQVYEQSTTSQQEALCAQKHVMTGPGLGFICLNEIPDRIHGRLGFIDLDGAGSYSSDFLSYAFYRLLGSRVKTPKILLKTISNADRSKSKLLQVSEIVEGVPLRRLLGMGRAISKSEELFKRALKTPDLYLATLAKEGFFAVIQSQNAKHDFQVNYRNWLQGHDNSVKHGLDVVWKNFEAIKNVFVNYDTAYLYENTPNIENFISSDCFSQHFLVSLLTNPKNQGADDFTVVIKHNEGGIKSVTLIEHANAHTFGDSDEVRSILYLLKPMDKPFSGAVAKRLRNMTPEGLLFGWLVALQEQNRLYMQSIHQEAFGDNDLPLIQIAYDLVPRIYEKLQKILQMVAENSEVTHRELLAALEPEIESLHRTAGENHTTAKKAFTELVGKNNIVIKDQVTKRKVSIAEAAASFLKSIELDKLQSWVQVSLVGKALAVFPEACRELTLPGDPASPSTRAEYFFFAVEQGHIELVAQLLREEKLALEGEKKGLLHCRNAADQTALLLACHKLNLRMVQLLIESGANPRDIDQGEQSALYICIAQFAENPMQSAILIQYLLEETGYLGDGLIDNQRISSLHLLARAASNVPAAVAAFLPYLVEKGANIDLIDEADETALDYAIKKQNVGLVEQLILLGGGRTLKVQKALEFFDSHPELVSTFKMLKQNSLLLRWHIGLSEICDAAAKNQMENNNLLSPDFGEAVLPSAIVSGLSDTQAVDWTLSSSSLQVKKWADRPNARYAVQKLFELLIGHGMSYGCLAHHSYMRGVVWNSEIKDLLSISQKVPGDSLADVITNSDKKDQLSKLDHQAFSELLLACCLVNFQCLRLKDLILEPIPKSGTYRLVNIGNSQAFIYPAIKEDGQTLFAANVLFCLDLMKRRIHPGAQERFLSFDPDHILKSWKNDVVLKEEGYGKQSIKNCFTNREGSISHLCQQFRRLQAVLRDHKDLNGLKLLEYLDPRLGAICSDIFRNYPSQWDRVAMLFQRLDTKPQYASSSSLFLWSGPVNAPSDNVLSVTTHELKSIEKERQMEPDDLREIGLALLKGDAQSFHRLHLDSTKQKVINGLDFAQIEGTAKQKRKIQAGLLGLIEKGWYQSLCLTGCTLTADFFRQLFAHSPLLASLELRNCKVAEDVFAQLVFARGLTDLSLVGIMQHAKLSFPYPSLRRIHLADCGQLSEIVISTSLEHLSVENLNLTSISPSGKGAKAFSLGTLHLKGCPKIEFWDDTLQPLLESAKELWLHNVPCGGTSEERYPSLILCLASQPKVSEIVSLLEYKPETKQSAKLIAIVQDYMRTSRKELRLAQITDEELRTLGYCCTDVTGVLISASQLTDAGLLRFVNQCPLIKSLTLDNCPRITWAGLNKIAGVCRGLEVLNLSLKEPISDDTVLELVRYTPHLSNLTVLGENRMTEAGVQQLAQHCRNLRRLHLEQCNSSMLKGLVSVAEKLAIDSLELTFTQEATSDDLNALFERCSQLVCLSLTESKECSALITDAVLEKLNKKMLHTLRLQNCTQVTTKSLQGFVYLTELELTGCGEISMDSLVKMLPEACPELARLILKNALVSSKEIERLKNQMPGLICTVSE